MTDWFILGLVAFNAFYWLTWIKINDWRCNSSQYPENFGKMPLFLWFPKDYKEWRERDK